MIEIQFNFKIYNIISIVDRVNIIKAGSDFINGSLIFIWNPIAPIIKHPIKNAEISIRDGNQIPNINKQASDNFEKPIIFIIESPNP